MIARSVQTIFCDDIRQEVGGKLSYIGVYSTSMFVSEFPITLPKFCVSAIVVSSLADPIKNLVIRIFRNDEVLAEHTVEEETMAAIADAVPEWPEDDSIDRAQQFHFNFITSPLIIEDTAMIRVRAETEKGELKGAALTVIQAEQSK